MMENVTLEWSKLPDEEEQARALVSIAISLKRIADSMEQPKIEGAKIDITKLYGVK